MEPHQKMHYLFHTLLRKLFKIIGHDIFRDGEFKPYHSTYVIYVLLFVFFMGAIKTLAFYDMVVVLNMIAYIGLVFELMMKMYSVKYGRMLVGLMDKLIEIFAANSKSDSRNRLILIHKFAIITEIVLKGGCAVYTLAGGFYLLNPIYSYYWRNEIVPLVPVYLPLIDENTTSGFILLTAVHLIFLVLAVIGSACTDFMFVMIIVNMPVLSNIFSDNIRELNANLREEIADHLLVKAKFKNILLLHREFWNIIDALDETFFKICFVQISSAAASAAVELFICIKIEFFPAIGLSVGFLVQIVCFCAIGTIVEICNSEIYDAIILGDWFLLSTSDQMVYKFLMLNLQETKALSIGGIAPLNMTTCVSIFKTIYSYLMLLFTFIS